MSLRMYYFLALCLPIALVVAGCTGKTPQAVYYTLNVTKDADAALQATAPPQDILIGIGSVNFPDELDRPSIVTRSGLNRLEVNEFHRWGGSLKKNFTQVVMENISIFMTRCLPMFLKAQKSSPVKMRRLNSGLTPCLMNG